MSYRQPFVLFIILTILSLSPLIGQVVYVDADATGSNNGSSWTNAYADLSDALANTSSGAIWIAEGTYTPGGVSPDTSSRFVIPSGLELYGGFVGTETMLAERNIDTNMTILSGDLNADDMVGAIELNKEDNVLHVVYVDSLQSETVVLDGLTISGGYNNGFSNVIADFFWRGAGLYALSTVEIRHCTFTENRGYGGAAVHLSGAGVAGSLLSHNTFSDNHALGQGVLYALGVSGLTVQACDFVDNFTNRGSFYPGFCEDVLIDSCLFDGNTNVGIGNFGAGLYSWQNSNVEVSNSVFRDNIAENASGIYIDRQTVLDLDHTNFRVTNCQFEGNQAGGFGGAAIYSWRASYTLDGCSFDGNVGSGGGAGGAIANLGNDKFYRILNCSFTGNQNEFGGGSVNYGSNTTGYFENCEFRQNQAFTSGGTTLVGFSAQVTFNDCTFNGNLGRWGGALYAQNDSSALNVQNSFFTGNIVDNLGGAIVYSNGASGMIEKSDFEGNQANRGGAIHMDDSPNNFGNVEIDRCSFVFNLANADQGGALNIDGVNVEVTSSLFSNNIASGAGTGGAISANASLTEVVPTVVTIRNATIVENTGILAGGIATWTDTVGGLTLNLQNTFLSNFGPNYAVEDGNPMLLSQGGNFVADASANAFLMEPTDQVDVSADPLFIDPSDNDFRLQEGSPLINAGVAAGAPTLDLDGNARVGVPDIGCYEFQMVSDTDDIAIDQSTKLLVLPNPARTDAAVILDSEVQGVIAIELVNVQGQLLQQTTQYKGRGEETIPLSVATLPAGVYLVRVHQAGVTYTTRFVKQ